MDLINREAVISIATSSCLDLDSYDDTDEFCNEVKELPSAFEGMTNGEVIKALFPNAYIEYWAEYSTYNIEFPNDNDVKHFNYSWWNAPYKGEREETE